MVASAIGASAGALLTWLMAPPVAPRPASDEVGSLGHFDLLEIERIARVAAEVAHAVDEHVGARAEAANGQLIAGGHAALAGLEGDAGDVAQHVAQGGGALLVHHRARDHGDGLRNVAQRFGQLRRRDDADAAGDFNGLRQLPNFNEHGGSRAPEIETRAFEDARQRVINAERTRHAR